MKKKIVLVAGARPNFMKIAPILREMETSYEAVLESVLVHTGQHYDSVMSDAFFENLGIRAPDHNLGVGSGSHAEQTARIMTRFEKVCELERPDTVVVVGDVNSTVAAALTAKKLQIDVAHVEAGLRSGDRTMPEEINRLATDAVSDIFFVTENEGVENLLREGHPEEGIHFVGHVMIDNLFYQTQELERKGPSHEASLLRKQLPEQYGCLTLHRPSTVDSRERLEGLIETFVALSRELPLVFPCHPRTYRQLKTFGLLNRFGNGFVLVPPLGYNDFLYLWKYAQVVLTDSGGLQEETTALGIPCLTLRENTERPITVEIGTNTLVGNRREEILSHVSAVKDGSYKQGRVPELWDGRASERICTLLASGPQDLLSNMVLPGSGKAASS